MGNDLSDVKVLMILILKFLRWVFKNVTKKYIKHVGGKTHEEKNGTCT